MAEITLATLSVQFAEEDRGRIILEQTIKIPRFDEQNKSILIAECYRSDPVEYAASVGEVRSVNRIPRLIYSEGIRFTGTNSATLKYPGAIDVSIFQGNVLMTKIKRHGRFVFQRSHAGLIYDEATESVITEDGSAVYGAVSVRYTTIYDNLYYYPQFQDFRAQRGGFVTTIGTIFAYNENTVATLEMEVDINTSPDYIEYARVTSKIVLDAKGVWEFPPNWKATYQANKEKEGDQRDDYPDEGTFPYSAQKVDGGNSFVDERLHLIIEINSFGRLRYNNHNTRIYPPYIGMYNYNPDYEIRFADPPGGARATSAEDFKHSQNNRTWRTVFAGVNKQKLLERLQIEYPGATEV